MARCLLFGAGRKNGWMSNDKYEIISLYIYDKLISIQIAADNIC
jgi:hypothetical protein